jgi:hypothetical protein
MMKEDHNQASILALFVIEFFFFSFRAYHLRSASEAVCLLSVLLQPSDEVIAVLALLQTGKGHLGTGNVLLWVFKVVEKSVSVPVNSLGLVGRRVRVSLYLTTLSSKDTLQEEKT